MATLVIDYDSLTKVANNASSLAKRAESYANDLTSKVLNKFSGISGGSTTYTADAKYYVRAKITALKTKQASYSGLSKQITTFIDNAKRIDQEVEKMIANNQEKFLSKNEHLRIDDWKATLLNWLVDLKNSCPLFEIIGNALRDIGTAMSDMFANIKYWYKCEGGKEIVSFVLAIGGAIVAVLLFIASFPASGFFAICAMIGAAITAVNAIVNVFTSYSSMKSARNGDPAWAKIYGKQDKLSDVLRQTNFGNGTLNRLSYFGATVIDGVELFCDIVNIIHAVGQIKSKLSFIQNYFDKNNGGLFTYFKEAKYTEVMDYDSWGNPCGKKWTLKVNEYGIVETRFTPKSIWRGIKAFVMDSPIDCNSDTGIRTLLNQNFKLDFKDWRNSFSIQGFKDTFRYTVTDGGRITFSDWKNSFNFRGMVDTIKYNFKYSSTKGMFTAGIDWKYKKDMIKTTANGIKSAIGISEKIGSYIEGSYDFKSEIMKKVYNFSDLTAILNKTGATKTVGDKLGWKYTSSGVGQKVWNTITNTYPYKAAHAG